MSLGPHTPYPHHTRLHPAGPLCHPRKRGLARTHPLALEAVGRSSACPQQGPKDQLHHVKPGLGTDLELFLRTKPAEVFSWPQIKPGHYNCVSKASAAKQPGNRGPWRTLLTGHATFQSRSHERAGDRAVVVNPQAQSPQGWRAGGRGGVNQNGRVSKVTEMETVGNGSSW